MPSSASRIGIPALPKTAICRLKCINSLRGTFFGVISSCAIRWRMPGVPFGGTCSTAGRMSSTVATPPAPRDTWAIVSALLRRRRIIISGPSVRVDGSDDLRDGRDVVLDQLDGFILKGSHSLRDSHSPKLILRCPPDYEALYLRGDLQ